MNNRGWGLQAMILWCAVLGLLLIFATVAINGSINSLYDNDNQRHSNGSSVIKKEDKEKEENKKEEDIKDDKEEDKGEDKDYVVFLDTMISASKKYVKDNYSENYESADHMKLSTKMLINNDYMSRIVDPNNKSLECMGYIAIEYVNNELIYEPYLKCGNNYETEGFIARHAE